MKEDWKENNTTPGFIFGLILSSFIFFLSYNYFKNANELGAYIFGTLTTIAGIIIYITIKESYFTPRFEYINKKIYISKINKKIEIPKNKIHSIILTYETHRTKTKISTILLCMNQEETEAVIQVYKGIITPEFKKQINIKRNIKEYKVGTYKEDLGILLSKEYYKDNITHLIEQYKNPTFKKNINKTTKYN
ncbi:hypothetical protein K9L67_05530 [Candidatus Woesearchaeota archaeon]|nr:hypothetical protein [Candidatus Woesearchaeota archaeon]MCF7901659.1 hypothetical protein [Candidatus Woesearchaeota archaeon]MCF8013856.1 hypothetical protein [Candidatus Woesearchaeota archaeon]